TPPTSPYTLSLHDALPIFAVPLAVGRHDVPGGVVGVAPAQDLPEGVLVVGPQGPLVDVALVELPALVGVVEPVQEPRPLLLVGRSEEHTSELQSLAYLVCR